MPCFRPLTGWRSRTTNASGKRSITFSKKESLPEGHPKYEQLTIPCGQCIHCRLEHSRQWAMRCYHESKSHNENCFVTLTYSPEHLPEHGFLVYRDVVLFMKRLRKEHGEGIRSYGCAEYGDQGNRPHYHLCIFGYEPKNKKLYSKRGGFELYESEELSKLWKYGMVLFGEVNFETAAYVARYITKKITGKEAEKHYEYLDTNTGEILQKPPEKAICISRRPGIGKTWFEKNAEYTQEHDHIILRGKKLKPPKYYDYLGEKQNETKIKNIKKERKINGKKFQNELDKQDKKNFDNYVKKINGQIPKARLYVIEQLKELQHSRLIRGYELEAFPAGTIPAGSIENGDKK